MEDKEIKKEGVKEVSPPSKPKKAALPVGRIAIFYKHWIEASQVSPAFSHTTMKSWRKDQIVRVEEDIDRLLSVNAPMRVYKEDVN